MHKTRPLPVEQGYNAWSAVYDTDGNPLIALEEPVVRAWLRESAGKTVLDVGSGTGRHTQWLQRGGAKVVALDFSEGMMAKARAKVGPGFVLFCRHALPAPLPLASGSCDHVVFALVADHIEALDPVFNEFHRVLRPGGSVVFTVLHPAMEQFGLTAGFSDPETGEKMHVESVPNTFTDYLMPIIRANLRITEMIERVVDEDLIAKAPRAAKYQGWPMLLAIQAQR